MAVLNNQMVIVTGQTFINPKSETNPTSPIPYQNSL